MNFQKICGYLGGAVAAATMMVSGAAAQDFSKVEIKTTELAKGIYMLTGAGGNMGVSVGDDGVFLIDDQFAPLTAKIKAAIAKLSDKPVKFVINTHWHFDHTGGNENLGKEGAIIVAHDMVREMMLEDQFIAAFNAHVPAAPAAALPSITFSDSTTFYLNGETLHVRHLEPAHTESDSIIHFRDSDVIHTGDIFMNGFYPFIDAPHGGSVDGSIANATIIIGLAGQDTKIIPGHGPLGNRDQLIAFRDMLVVVRDNIQALIDAGKTEAEIIAAKPTAELDATWAKGPIKPDVFVGLIYASMKN
jgi:glyoxylase-like metal-dependent hydrolase (beta-lactamase superfamily II)